MKEKNSCGRVGNEERGKEQKKAIMVVEEEINKANTYKSLE